MYVMILLVALFALTGCGKTYDSSVKAAKCLLDIPIAVYQDTKDNALIVKDEFEHPVPPPGK